MRARTTSRRDVLLGAAGVATLALAGCGGQTGTGNAGSDAKADKGFPVTVPGRLGATTVQGRPRRVVACGYLRDTDTALALGANLVGVAKSAAFPGGLAPWQRPPADVELFDTANGTPLEKVAGLRPDVILANDDYKLTQDYPNLTKIAPTLGYGNGLGKDSWQEMARRAGAVLGARDKAEQVITSVQRQVAAARAAHPELAGKTYTFGPVGADGSVYTISSETDSAAVFFGQLGMRLAPKVTTLPRSATAGRAQVSAERLDVLDADVLMLNFQSPAVRAKLEANPLFAMLPAVRRGAYLALDLGPSIALAFPSLLSIPYGLRAVVPRLAAAVAKH